ncbi:MAG: M3 family oligoendopeptidase [Bacteroidetes bacterium]|nr:M3 family oligoendopeptidase [Bacteroidota bacterium]
MESKLSTLQNTNVKNWNIIEGIYNELLTRKVTSLLELKNLILEKDIIDSSISEEFGWRYINMTKDTANPQFAKLYEEYLKNVIPKVEEISNKLNLKIINNEYINELKKEEGYDILIKSIKYELKIFRELNLPLIVDLQIKSQEYNTIVSSMTINFENQEITLQQASTKLEESNRELRKEIYIKIGDRRLEDKDKIDKIFSEMIIKRDKIAKNANCKTFSEYMFIKLKRFDYTINDCHQFHETTKKEIVPILNLLAQKRKESLKLDNLKPWDLAVDIYKNKPLKPFNNEEDLLNKTVNVFNKIDPFFGDCIKKMKSLGHLDLLTRKNKAPGGYNYPLNKTGIPFIFMNATHTFDDMITMLHEGGHAVHSFLAKDLTLSAFKNAPLEVSEVASMGMELISMKYWDIFFRDKQDLTRAKLLHLYRIISILPWVATIDKFQHWIYTNPNHTKEERKHIWNKIFNEFSDNVVDWEGQEKYKDYIWQKQLHLFEVPFYYIEYAIAQLAAISIWKNYNENRKEGIKKYINALKLGSLKSIPETYKEAGIEFSFSQKYIRELMEFITEKIEENENLLIELQN